LKRDAEIERNNLADISFDYDDEIENTNNKVNIFKNAIHKFFDQTIIKTNKEKHGKSKYIVDAP
jgi:hypothetical protein